MQIEPEVATVTADRPARKNRNYPHGLFEKVPGSKVWWIRYADSMGRSRREKAGTKGAAIDLYRKRKTEALQGKKLPENLRSPMVSFAELARETLAYSKTHKRSYDDDVIRQPRQTRERNRGFMEFASAAAAAGARFGLTKRSLNSPTVSGRH